MDHLTEPAERRGLQRLLNVSQVAELLGVHPKSVYKWARNGDLPKVGVGRSIRFRPSDIEHWMNEQ